MNSYLLTLVLKPDLDEKERAVFLDSLKKKVETEEGKITKEDLWGIKDLSYTIKKQNKGFYAHFEFTQDPSKTPGLDKMLKLEEDVLRYLLVRV